MTAEVRPIPFWSEAEIEAAIPGTIDHLNARRVLAYPTETVYGFGGAVDHESVQELIKTALNRRTNMKKYRFFN